MLTYATPADLADALDAAGVEPVPDERRARALIAAASRMVTRAARHAVYAVTPAGLPHDEDVAAAFRDATVAQAVYWTTNGVDPIAAGAGSVKGSGEATESAIGSARVKFDSAAGVAAAARARSLRYLCDAADDILAAVLTPGRPYVYGSGVW